MSANSKPLAPATIDSWVLGATATLRHADIPSARLDAELILAFCLDKDRSWLIAHGDSRLESNNRQFADTLLEKRCEHLPLAYLFGRKEFYRREFFVTSDVLIPRPESETMIDILKTLKLPEPVVIHDVGTGSGCLAITAKLELPHADVTGSDISPEALQVARKNASHLSATLTFRQDDLMNSHFPTGGVSVILANLPYVDPSWRRSRSTDHEPTLALFADDKGLSLIKRLLEQAPSRLAPNGFILFEADPAQHEAIIKTGALHGLRHTLTDDYIVVLQA